MNFIRDKELALRLKNNAVSSREKFLYFFISSMMTSLMMTSSVTHFFHYAVELNSWDNAVDVATVILAIFGTLLCYRTNKKGDNKEFIERYVSLYFPVSIQMILLFIILATIIFGVLTIFAPFGEIPEQTSALDLALIIVAYLYFYLRLNASIKLASH
jgi:hypothetical protein